MADESRTTGYRGCQSRTAGDAGHLRLPKTETQQLLSQSWLTHRRRALLLRRQRLSSYGCSSETKVQFLVYSRVAYHQKSHLHHHRAFPRSSCLASSPVLHCSSSKVWQEEEGYSAQCEAEWISGHRAHHLFPQKMKSCSSTETTKGVTSLATTQPKGRVPYEVDDDDFDGQMTMKKTRKAG